MGKPEDIETHVKEASKVPQSWCIATSGTYYAAGEQGTDQWRPVSPHRIKEKNVWHRKPVKKEQLRVLWPPPPPPPGTVKQRLRWSSALGEGDVIGLLFTPFGGVVITINGAREMMIPDAGISVDRVMYPIIEVRNHIRSAR